MRNDIRKHLPEMPPYESPITIRHLVHHTSGIRDYLTLMSLAGMRYEDIYSEEEMVALPAHQKELNFTPGGEHLYSNSGYFLLSVIVKRASGKSLRQFADEHIFKPLGMRRTHFHDDRTMVVKNRVTSYFPQKEGGFGVHVTNFDKVGDGGLLTTIEDLARWDRNFYDYQVGGKEFVNQLLTPGQLNHGEKLQYAIQRATRRSNSSGEIDRIMRVAMPWAFGFQLGGEPKVPIFGKTSSPHVSAMQALGALWVGPIG